MRKLLFLLALLAAPALAQFNSPYNRGPIYAPNNVAITGGTILGISQLTVVGSSAVQISSSATTSFRSGTGAAIGNPPGTVTVGTGGVGTLAAGTYKWAIYENVGSTTTGVGTSQPSYAANGSESVLVTAPLNRRGVTRRMLCRTKVGGSVFYELFDFGSSTSSHQTEYVDNIPDASITALCPTVDTSALFDLEVNQSVKYYRSLPGTDPADITILTADPTTGTYSIDAYGTIVARASPVQEAFSAQATGTGSTLYAGYYIPVRYDGNSPTLVYQVSSRGVMVLNPQYDAVGFTITPAVATTASILSATAFAGSTGSTGLLNFRNGGFALSLRESGGVAATNRSAALSMQIGGNNAFFGHPNTAFLSSIGADSSNGYPTICYNCYHSSTANTWKYSGATQPPFKLWSDTTGFKIDGAATGSTDTNITWSNYMVISAAGTMTYSGPIITNSLRSLGSVSVGGALTLPTTGFGVTKGTAAASAPGAAGSLIQFVCGTNAGTGKFIAMGGTSTTPVTIVDNIGAGVTGC